MKKKKSETLVLHCFIGHFFLCRHICVLMSSFGLDHYDIYKLGVICMNACIHDYLYVFGIYTYTTNMYTHIYTYICIYICNQSSYLTLVQRKSSFHYPASLSISLT